MPIFVFIPKTVLGAMIIMAVITMFDYKTPMRIWKVRKIDLLPYFVSFFGTFYTLETGVLAGEHLILKDKKLMLIIVVEICLLQA